MADGSPSLRSIWLVGQVEERMRALVFDRPELEPDRALALSFDQMFEGRLIEIGDRAWTKKGQRP